MYDGVVLLRGRLLINITMNDWWRAITTKT